MEASRVSISDRTLLQAPTLSGKRKRELRIRVLKEYILARPYGKRVKTEEFRTLLHFKTSANAWAFIEKLVKRGILVKHEITPRTFFYTVEGEVRTSKLEPVMERAIDLGQAIEKHKQETARGGAQPTSTYTVAELKSKAMAYFWAYDDTTIKGFIKWLESQEG